MWRPVDRPGGVWLKPSVDGNERQPDRDERSDEQGVDPVKDGWLPDREPDREPDALQRDLLADRSMPD